MPPSKEQSWVDEFNEKFEFADLTSESARNNVISFIKQTLREQLTEILAEIERQRDVYDDDVDYRNDKYRIEGRNKVLLEVKESLSTRLSSLDSNQKEI